MFETFIVLTNEQCTGSLNESARARVYVCVQFVCDMCARVCECASVFLDATSQML